MNAVPLTRRPSRSRLAVRRVSPAARGGALASSGARLGGPALLFAFSLAAVGAGAGRALTTTYLPVLLERINDAPSLIGAVMTVNALAGFAVPIAVGVWSDRRGRRLPFIAGGAVLTAGGLVAVGLGNGTSYLALGLSAALVYAGLNALTTGHRAIVAEDVDDAGRPAATSAQEIAGLVGAVVAVAIGGALIEPAPAAAFALATVVLAITVVPTMIVSRRLGLGEREPARQSGDAERADASRAHAGRAANRFGRVLGDALRHPGAREVLVAQVLWVFAYAALPAFFVLYAEKSLGLGVGIAGALPLGFGLLTAVGMVVAGRAKPERVRPLLLAGAALLGGGLLAAAPAGSLAAAAPGFATAAVGAGLVTALGFPYFARFVPDGEAGRYSGLFFAGRAVAAAAALPLAGLAVELTGSYTAVLWLGAAALAALAPLAAAERAGVAASRPSAKAALAALRARRRFGARPASVAAVIPVFASERAVEVARGALRHVDELVLVDDGAPPADRRVARRPSRRRPGPHPPPRRERRQGQRRRRRRRAPARRVSSPGGHRRARLRRPARSRAHPRLRRSGPRGRRRDRPPPRPQLHAAAPPLRQPRRQPHPPRLGPRLDPRHPERHAPLPLRRPPRPPAAPGRLRRREPPPARAARRPPRRGLGRDPHDLRRRAEPLPDRLQTPSASGAPSPAARPPTPRPPRRAPAAPPPTPSPSSAPGCPASARWSSPPSPSASRCRSSSRSTTPSSSP